MWHAAILVSFSSCFSIWKAELQREEEERESLVPIDAAGSSSFHRNGLGSHSVSSFPRQFAMTAKILMLEMLIETFWMIE